MDEKKLEAAFNEWMRRFTETPEAYEREFQQVDRFLREQGHGEIPSYGATSVAYLKELMNEVN